MALGIPNLHPLVVHFPVVLVPAAVALDLAALRVRRIGLSQLGTGLWGLAAISVVAAYLAGRRAADSLIDVSPQGQAAIASHADAAGWALLMVLAVTLARIGLAILEPVDRTRWSTGARATLVALGVVLVGALAVAADRGGALVYRHGLAVAVPACPDPASGPPAAPEDEPAAAESRLVEAPDGALIWAPRPGDGSTLHATLVPQGPGTIEEIAPDGVLLQVDGLRRLLLPVPLGDVQVDARLDLSGFEGRIAVLHHAGEAIDDHGAFVVSTDGTVRLEDRTGAGLRTLDSGTIGRPGQVTVSVHASGRHLKGMIDGRMVTHGHHPPRPDGRSGLLIDGTGPLRIHRIEVTPLGGP